MSDAAHETYQNPLIARYASREMATLWGDLRKFRTWRKLWIALAEAEAELGLPIDSSQLDELRSKADDVDFAAAERHERLLRHDVMAHVTAYGEQCPSAKGIIHLGATSCYVTDNTDLMLMRDGLRMIARRMALVLGRLGNFASQYRDLPCLGWTHFQPAQPTTVGKRACLWAYDLAMDLLEIERRIVDLKWRGVKGTTGTQASFLSLFHGDHGKVKLLEKIVGEKLGFEEAYAVTGQTYSRKIDSQIISTLSGVAQSAHKAATDWRLLQSRKELEEPFEAKQVGSSAMAYKRNPMRAERICALSRFVMGLESSAAATFSTQWLERTLDDSANRRLTLPQAFLGIDAVLVLYHNVLGGLDVNPHVIAKNLGEELPFMATENILMAAVSAGGDRQELHERINRHSQAAAAVVKKQGKPNDLLSRLSSDPAFASVDIESVSQPSQFVGRAPQQVDEFLHDVLKPILARYANLTAESGEVRF